MIDLKERMRININTNVDLYRYTKMYEFCTFMLAPRILIGVIMNSIKMIKAFLTHLKQKTKDFGSGYVIVVFTILNGIPSSWFNFRCAALAIPSMTSGVSSPKPKIG